MRRLYQNFKSIGPSMLPTRHLKVAHFVSTISRDRVKAAKNFSLIEAAVIPRNDDIHIVCWFRTSSILNSSAEATCQQLLFLLISYLSVSVTYVLLKRSSVSLLFLISFFLIT
ncbi:hypothetical protein O3M35_005139 [Rhynocoris fuscipes]|uniref:Uncharacterized protein n=1 Tax=Rhynocoris fuscipes TaxID=488301 RepID=A0AAW1DMF9_9HEMI